MVTSLHVSNYNGAYILCDLTVIYTGPILKFPVVNAVKDLFRTHSMKISVNFPLVNTCNFPVFILSCRTYHPEHSIYYRRTDYINLHFSSFTGQKILN